MEQKFSKDEKRDCGIKLLSSKDWDIVCEVLDKMIALENSRRDSAQAKGETNQSQYYGGVVKGLSMLKEIPKNLVYQNTSTIEKVKDILSWAINSKNLSK